MADDTPLKHSDFTNSDRFYSVEKINSIISVSDHINFAKSLIQKYFISDFRKQSLFRKIEFIEEKVYSKTLNLAVLGEFSSGKSTFINALLRRRLLKSAPVATTASATFISYGDEFSVSVRFLDDRYVQATELNTTKLRTRISQINPNFLHKSSSLQDLIDLLTSNQDVANHVKRIDIQVPESKIQSGISIIDTPGIGAGADYTSSHVDLTTSVIEEFADAAIILIPSTHPMTKTLINFLTTKVKHLLHRCVFVVTAMDQQEEQDRRQTMDYISRRLTEEIDLKDPIVFQAAALKVLLPIDKISSDKRDVGLYWKNNFSELESILVDEMLRQRNFIISERLVSLLKGTFSEINKDIEKQQKENFAEEAALKANSVGVIETTLNQIFERGKDKISRKSNSCKSKLMSSNKDKFRSNIKYSVINIIDNTNWDALSKYEDVIAPKLKEVIEKEAQKFIEETHKEIRKLRDTSETVLSEFDDQFERNYRGLKALGVKINIPGITVFYPSISYIRFSSSKQYIQEIIDKSNRRSGWGAGIGGTLGLLVAGPVGAAVGVAAGAAVGAGSTESLKTCQSEIKAKLRNDVDQYIGQYAAKVKSAINNFESNAVSELQRIIELHVDEYSHTVRRMIADNQNKKKVVKDKLLSISFDSAELKKRKENLEKLQSQLRHM